MLGRTQVATEAAAETATVTVAVDLVPLVQYCVCSLDDQIARSLSDSATRLFPSLIILPRGRSPIE